MSTPYSPDEILHAFALEPIHDQATIDKYVSRYPELATDFIDLLVDLRLAAELPPATVEPESRESLDVSFARFMVSDDSKAAANLFEPFKGQAFIKLAKTLNVPRAFLTAVRDRLVIPTSFPAHFLNRLASAMQETPSRLHAYLSLSPTSNTALNFRADGQPGEVEQVTFAQLVKDTEMDEEQRSLLREDP